MKILITEKQLKLIVDDKFDINELSSMSSASRSWIDILINVSNSLGYKNINKFKKDYPEGYDTVLLGKDYPEAYARFPVDKFELKIAADIIKYDEQISGYKNNQYVVYFILSPMSEKSHISHELKHAFEDYKRLTKGKPGLKDTKESKLFFWPVMDFEKLVTDKSSKYAPFSDILRGIYYTSKIEESAFSDTVFDGYDELIPYLYDYINGRFERNMRYFPENMLQNSWNNVKHDFKIPIFNKYNDYKPFLTWSLEYIKYRASKVIKRLQKVKYFRDNMK